MSEPKKTAGVVNFKRRTWDEEEYAKLAKEREANQGRRREYEAPAKAPEGAVCPPGSEQAYLQARDSSLSKSLESRVGSKSTVTQSSDGRDRSGFHCELCDYTCKDHVTYIDHVNSSRHQSRLGFSMKVQRSSVQSVKDRLKESLKRKATPSVANKFDYDALIKSRVEDEQRQEEEKQKRKKQKKEQKKQEDAEEAAEGMDPDMMAMMGFGSFGSSKQKK